MLDKETSCLGLKAQTTWSNVGLQNRDHHLVVLCIWMRIDVYGDF